MAAPLCMLFFLFSACGELDSLFSKNDAYPVKVLINGSSLEECSIIRPDDTISPYFASPVDDDPDLTGLLVYFKNDHGIIAGEKIWYVLNPNAEVEEAGADKTDTDEPVLAVRERWTFFNPVPEADDARVIIEVPSLDRNMPCFSIPAGMEPGCYSLIFEALGKNVTLSQTILDVFYLGNYKFEPHDVLVSLPGISESRLIPPGTMVMLETALDYDPFLDPYIIWYSGKNVISEGLASEGAGCIFWKAPDQSGFYPLKVEIFPFRLSPNYAGVRREITLPVSSKAVIGSYFFTDEFIPQSSLALGAASAMPDDLEADADSEESENAVLAEKIYPAPELLRYFQLKGSLSDSLSLADAAQALLPPASPDDSLSRLQEPLWVSSGGHYGLSTGPDSIWSISPVKFTQDAKDLPPGTGEPHPYSGGILLFHIRPLQEAALMSVFFPYQSVDSGVSMELARKDHAVVLRLQSRERAAEIAVFRFIDPDVFIPAAVEFYMRPDRLEVKLTLGEDSLSQSQSGSISLPYPLSGEGRITLGGGLQPQPKVPEKAIAPEPDGEIPHEASGHAAELPVSAAVWSELAVMRSASPIFHEEAPAESEFVILQENAEEAEEESPVAGYDQSGPNAEAAAARDDRLYQMVWAQAASQNDDVQIIVAAADSNGSSQEAAVE